MKKRILTGTVLSLILIPIILFNELLPVFEIIVTILASVAMIELLNMYDKEKKISIGMKILSVALMLILFGSIVNSFNLPVEVKPLIVKATDAIGGNEVRGIYNPFFALLLTFIILMSGLVFVSHYTVADLGKIYISVIYVGVCAGCLVLLRFMGRRMLIYLLAIKVCTDVFALVFGLLFGKHKMAPTISPKKTWEGAIGGTLTALVVGVAFIITYEYLPKTINKEGIVFFENIFDFQNFSLAGRIFFSIILTLFLSVCSQIGDLVASKLKRTYGIKDYSNIFPGHGGVLDRFDSAFFASAIFILIIQTEISLYSIAGTIS